MSIERSVRDRMSPSAWSALARETIAALPLREDDRAQALRDLEGADATLGMRGVPTEVVLKHIQGVCPDEAIARYIELRERMSPFNPYGFMPMREVVLAILFEAAHSRPWEPLETASNARTQEVTPMTLSQPHFQLMMRLADGDLVEFLRALSGSEGFVTDHGSLTVMVDGDRATLGCEGFSWRLCRYFFPGFFRGVCARLEVDADLTAAVHADERFDLIFARG